ncbi:MAG: hypothetical protein [Bacteriophage sp.]|nr:MAG: hypothetical protein [Bacteriophage sp.]
MEFDYKNPESIFYLKKESITKDFLIDTFAILGNNKTAKLPSNTKVKITSSIKDSTSIIKNSPNIDTLIKNSEITTIGRILAYQYLMDIPFDFIDSNGKRQIGNLSQYVDFQNAAITKKVLENKYDAKVAEVYLDGKIESKTIEAYTNNLQWLGYTSAIFTLPSLDSKTINPSKAIKKFKEQKFKEYAVDIKNMNLEQITKMEKEILDFCSQQLPKDNATGRHIYDSGFNGSFSNNYKVTSIMRGLAPKSDNINEFSVGLSNLNDGVSKEDLVTHADLGVVGASGRAKDTALAGYKTKIFNAAFGTMVAGKKNTDCKTTGTLKVEITESNFKSYLYRNAIIKGKVVQLTNDNKNEFIGKTIELRSPLYCHNTDICNACLGDMTYKLKILHIGLNVSRITTKLMNLSMKAFHNLSVKPNSYNLLDYIKESK